MHLSTCTYQEIIFLLMLVIIYFSLTYSVLRCLILSYVSFVNWLD